MNVLLIGSNYFERALLDLGCRVMRAGGDDEAGLSGFGGDLDLPTVLAACPDRPSAVVLTDDLGRRVIPSGLEKVDLLKVWYGVDGPINYYWHRHYAPLFDVVLADQKDCAESLDLLSPAGASWLPVAVDTSVYQGPPEEKIHDLAFVGVINEVVRPKRFRIVNLLAEKYKLKTAGGRDPSTWVGPAQAARLYRQSRIVINENLFDGVTTRMFEALASGSMLLTENTGNGLTDLFKPGRHLGVFGPRDLFDQVDYYLSADKERERVAAAGRDLALARHDIKNRARILLDLIEKNRPGVGLTEGPDFFREQGKVLFLTALRWPGHDGPQRLLRAEKLLFQAQKLGRADREALFFLGLMARIKGDAYKAGQWLARAATAGSLRARIGLGLLVMQNGRTRTGLVHLSRTAEDFGLDFPLTCAGNDRLSPEQHLVLGRMLEAKKRDITPGFSKYSRDMLFWDAFEHYRAAVDLDPGNIEALVRIGHILAGRGAQAEAHYFYARALELQPQRMDLVLAEAEAALHGYLPEKVRRAA